MGHIPRSMTVVARGESTRESIPGDIVNIGGIFLPTPYTGFQVRGEAGRWVLALCGSLAQAARRQYL